MHCTTSHCADYDISRQQELFSFIFRLSLTGLLGSVQGQEAGVWTHRLQLSLAEVAQVVSTPHRSQAQADQARRAGAPPPHQGSYWDSRWAEPSAWDLAA